MQCFAALKLSLVEKESHCGAPLSEIVAKMDKLNFFIWMSSRLLAIAIGGEQTE